MSWTSIVIDIVLFAFVTIVGYVSKAYLIPWLQTNHLVQAAKIAVAAAEAIYGRYNGEQKLKNALDQMKQQGWDIESQKVISAIEAAWQSLNLEQIACGYKEVEITTEN